LRFFFDLTPAGLDLPIEFADAVKMTAHGGLGGVRVARCDCGVDALVRVEALKARRIEAFSARLAVTRCSISHSAIAVCKDVKIGFADIFASTK
jgi:hypothetical protein